MSKINPKQYFKSLEDLYKLRMGSFMQTANKHIFNRDYSIDAIQDAFTKAQTYHTKHPDRNFREQILHVLVIRACRKYNKKYGAEIPFGDMTQFDGFSVE